MSHSTHSGTPSLSRRAFLAAATLAGAAGGVGCAGGDVGDDDPRTATDTVAGDAPDTRTLDERVEDAIAGLTTEQRVAQLFVIQPESLVENSPVVQAGDATRAALAERPVGGICYFAQNLLDPDQTREMLANTRSFSEEAVGLPPLLAVDEEGGTVARVASNAAFGVTDVGDMRDVGATGDASRAAEAASTIASYLLDLGFNLDFAPVADVANNPESDTMARRSFGTSADEVAPMVEAAVGAFLDTGLLCSAKHFPGIGGAVGDSHTGAISTDKTADELAAEELRPFEAAISAGVPIVMVGHIGCPRVTGDDLPASLSQAVIGGLLRDRLEFDGVVVTDSLGMAAVTQVCEPGEVGVRALSAGVDLLLMPENFEAAYQGVLEALRTGGLSEERVVESLRRVLRVKLGLAG